jgi:hypothetical protein
MIMTNSNVRTLESAVANSADLLSDDELAVAVGGLSLHDFILPKVPARLSPLGPRPPVDTLPVEPTPPGSVL